MRNLFFLILFLSLACGEPYYHPQSYYDAIQIPDFYPCQGHDNSDLYFDKKSIFLSGVKEVYICTFLDPKSPSLGPTGLFLTLRWTHISSEDFRRYRDYKRYKLHAGWSYLAIKAPPNGFPIGLYEVKLDSGRIVEGKTTFEIVKAE